MPTRPPSPDPSGTASNDNPFAGLSAAGLGFFQDWMKAASSALPNLGGSAASAGAAWTMPTLDPQELDKRIQDLKTVQFWLEQNARMIGMTIQTLEVQRMTLQTLQGMKVPLDALRESLQVKVPPVSPAPAAPSSPASPFARTAATPEAPSANAGGQSDDAPAAADEAPAPPPGVNPMQWWSTRTEQFSNLASQAVQAGQEAMTPRATPANEPKAEDGAKPARRANPTGKPRTARPTASRKTPPKA